MIYSIAGMTVELDFKYKYGEEKCERYLSEGSPVFSAFATDEDIQKEKLLTPENSIEVCEFDSVFRKLYNFAPTKGRILVHGAALMMDGKAYLFTAPSGTGKSTHIKLWGKKFGKDVTVIDGDKPFISFENGKAFVWGSPRCGKEGWNNPISAPLCGIAFLVRSERNRIEKVSPLEMAEKFFAQCYIPKSKETAMLTIDIINNILTTVPLYKLYCNMETEAAEVAYNGMK